MRPIFRDGSADDALMQATSDVTEGLRRTLQLMQQEVDRSMTSNELLGKNERRADTQPRSGGTRLTNSRAHQYASVWTAESQTQTMQLTSDQYSTLSSLMNTSKNLITTLERSNILDRLVLFGAFAFFAAVCAHIFKKRVIDRGVHVVGALGGLVARGGNAVAGVARRGGGVEQASEEAKHVVKQGIVDEWAKATAVAAGAAGAIRAGIDMARSKGTQALHERNVPTQTPPRYRSGEEDVRQDIEADVFEEVLPQEEEPPIVAAPVTARESRDEAGEPLHIVDEDMSLDEPIPAAASTGEAFKPAVVEPLDEEEFEDLAEKDASGEDTAEHDREALDPSATAVEEEAEIHADELSSQEAEEDQIYHEPGHSIQAGDEPDLPPAHEADTIALRQPHPPTPSLPDIADLAFETPSAAEMPVQKPDLEEAVQAAEASSANGVTPEPLVEIAQEHPDGVAEEVGDTYDESGAVSDVAPTSGRVDRPAPAAAASLDASAHSHLAELPVDYSDLDVDAVPSRVVPVQLGEREPELVAALADLSAEDESPRDVAGVEGTTTPLDVSDLENAPPALDVEGTGEIPAADPSSDEDHTVELPVDFASEQTLWTRENREGGSTSDHEQDQEEGREPTSFVEGYEPHEQADEALLEELLERQMGGVAGGAYLAAPASFNDTTESSHEDDAQVLHPDDPSDEEAEVTRSVGEVQHTDSDDDETLKTLTGSPLASPEPVADADLARTIGLSEAVELSTATTTLEPTPSRAAPSSAPVPEPTLSQELAHAQAVDQEVSVDVDATLAEAEEPEQPEPAEPEPEEPASSASTPTPTAYDSTTASSAVAMESESPEDAPASDASKPSQSAIPTLYTEGVSAASSPDENSLDLDPVLAQPAASAAASRPPPFLEHLIVANPKLSVEAQAVGADDLNVLDLESSGGIVTEPETTTPPRICEPDGDWVESAEPPEPVSLQDLDSAAHGDIDDGEDVVSLSPEAAEEVPADAYGDVSGGGNVLQWDTDAGDYEVGDEEAVANARVYEETPIVRPIADADDAPLHVEL